jgi:PAS domain S-box-containing protein
MATASPGNRDIGLRATLFDSTVIREAQEAVDFITNTLQASTEYSIIGIGLDGKILPWNEGARRLYGYEPEEVVGRASSESLHTPEDVATGKPREIRAAALDAGKWEGTINRIRKNGKRFTARVVITPRRDGSGRPAFCSSPRTSRMKSASPRNCAPANITPVR